MSNRMVLPITALLALGTSSVLVAQSGTGRDERIAGPPMVRLYADHAGSGYSWGQPIRVRFSADRDAFVMVANVSEDGRLSVLYPRTPLEHSAVFGNTQYFVDTRPWSGVVGAATNGTYGYIFAIASDEPLDLSRFTSRSGRTWMTSYFQFARYGTSRPEAERMIDQVADEVLFDRQVQYGYDLQYYFVEGARYHSTRSCWGLYCNRYGAAWSSYCSTLLFGFPYFQSGIIPWECRYQPRYYSRYYVTGRPTYPRPNPPPRPTPRDRMPIPPVDGLKPDTVHWIVPDSAPQNRKQPATKPTITIVAQNEPDTAGFGNGRRLRDSNLEGLRGGAPINRRGIRPEVVALDSPLEPVRRRNADAMPRVYRPTPSEPGRPRVVEVEPTTPNDERTRTLRPERADDGIGAQPRAERQDPPRMARPERAAPEPRAEPPRVERPRQEQPRVERPRPTPQRVEQPRRDPPRVVQPKVERRPAQRPQAERQRPQAERPRPARVERPAERPRPARVERPVQRPRAEPARVERPRVERRSPPPPKRVEPVKRKP